MLKDEEIIPTCQMIARRFLRQGLRVLGGSSKDVLDELTNVGYIYAKPLKSTHHIKTWIIWKMSEYLSSTRDVSGSKHSGELVDRRLRSFKNGELDPAFAAETNEEMERLIGAMKKIDEGKREMLMMKYMDGMTYEGIGEVYGMSRTKISKDVRMVLGELKEIMR